MIFINKKLCYRVVLSSLVAYNLEERSFRKMQDFPDVIQNPPVCVHKGNLYVGGQKNIYIYNHFGEKDCWKKVLDTDIRANYMVSLGEHIYVSQNYFSHLFRFNPNGENQKLVSLNSFSSSVAAMCNVGEIYFIFLHRLPLSVVGGCPKDVNLNCFASNHFYFLNPAPVSDC